MRRRPAIERAVALRLSCGQCVSMLASTSPVVTPPSKRPELGWPRHVAVAQRHGSVGCQISVLEMNRRDQRGKRGDIVVARLFAGRPGVGDVDERPEINNGFLVLIPGILQLFFFFFRLGLYLLRPP